MNKKRPIVASRVRDLTFRGEVPSFARAYLIDAIRRKFCEKTMNRYLKSVVERVHSHPLSLVTLEPPQIPLPRGNSAFPSPRGRRCAPAVSSFRLFRAPLASAAVALLAHLCNALFQKAFSNICVLTLPLPTWTRVNVYLGISHGSNNLRWRIPRGSRET